MVTILFWISLAVVIIVAGITNFMVVDSYLGQLTEGWWKEFMVPCGCIVFVFGAIVTLAVTGTIIFLEWAQ